MEVKATETKMFGPKRIIIHNSIWNWPRDMRALFQERLYSSCSLVLFVVVINSVVLRPYTYTRRHSSQFQCIKWIWDLVNEQRGVVICDCAGISVYDIMIVVCLCASEARLFGKEFSLKLRSTAIPNNCH